MSIVFEKFYDPNTWLAVFGIFLAVIGNYFPTVSDKLEETIRTIGVFCENESKNLFNPKDDKCRLYLTYVAIFIGLIYWFELDFIELFYFCVYSFYDYQTIFDFITTIVGTLIVFFLIAPVFFPFIIYLIFINTYFIKILKKNANRSALSGIGLLLAFYSFILIFISNVVDTSSESIILQNKAKIYLKSKGYAFMEDGTMIHKDHVKRIQSTIKKLEK